MSTANPETQVQTPGPGRQPSGPTDKRPLYETIADDLAGRIKAGVYAPETRLPGQVALAREFGVSTITSNRALAELERRNLVQRLPRRGTFVRQQPPRSLRSVLVPLNTEKLQQCPWRANYLEGVLLEARNRNVQVRVEPFNSPVLRSPDAVMEHGADGAFYIGRMDDDFPTHPIRLSGIPLIGVGFLHGPCDYFVSEHHSDGTKQLVTLLREDGCSRIGLLATLAFQNHRFCRDGYLAAMQDTGLEASLVRDTTPHNLPDNLHALLPMVDALVVAGQLGPRALSYLQGLGRNLPLGLYTESMDTLQYADICYIVHLDHTATGARAVQLMADIVEHGPSVRQWRLVKPRVTRPGEERGKD